MLFILQPTFIWLIHVSGCNIVYGIQYIETFHDLFFITFDDVYMESVVFYVPILSVVAMFQIMNTL